MSLWKNDTPPVLYPDAVATPAGWVDAKTGELLVTVIGLSTFKGQSSELKRVHIMGTKKIFADGDYIVLEADFTEPVTIASGTPQITATVNGNSRTFAYFVDSSDKVNPDRITSFTISSGGSNYAVNDVLTFTGGGGSSAKAKVSAVNGGGAITAISLISGGAGFTSAPTVGVTSVSGSGASITAVLGTLTNGSGTSKLRFRYQVATNETATSGQIVFTSPIGGTFTLADVGAGSASGATATATLSTTGSVKSVTVSGTGTGYTNGDTVTFTGGGGTGAAGTLVTSSGDVTSVTITNGGTGYTSAPTVTITSGSGTGKSFTAVIGKTISSINVTAGGTGYFTPPTVGFSGGGGTGAAGTAVVDRGVVKSVTITNAGTGYTSAPTVALTAVAEAPASSAFSTSAIATGFSIDAVHPTVSTMALSGASQTNHFYTGDFITFTATCSKVVYVTGTPYITVTINGSAKQARYYQGSKSNTLIFRYEVASGDVATASNVTVTSPINLNSGTIKDYQGNSLTLTFSGPTMTAQAVN